jgi:ribonuclease E
MAKRMLIDAAHPEETRVAVLNGNRLEEFDFESSTKQQVKGNIYLAKVTRVEPSLQAAFVEYGGNRHGFLAFSEIHPDYYRIPIGDREAAVGEPALPGASEVEDATDAAEDAGVALESALPEPVAVRDLVESGNGEAEGAEPRDDGPEGVVAEPSAVAAENGADRIDPNASTGGAVLVSGWDDFMPAAPDRPEIEVVYEEPALAISPSPDTAPPDDLPRDPEAEANAPAMLWDGSDAQDAQGLPPGDGQNGAEADPIETIGGDEFDEAPGQRSRLLRPYKIQEVVKRRQIMLVQVAKEERGTKGAALTTYLSLAGRYCVLMPNTARGGGVSRKITSIADRRRLKDILDELDIPEGMGVIVRTAGAERSKAEIRRDYEYLLRLWNEIRDLTLRSTAPALIYEEGNLIKRSIRDLYARDIDDVLVEGEEGYRTAKAFMKMLMPSHAKRVQPYRESQIGLFHRFQVESQIDAILAPSVQLRSGGYIVINQTEALVAIDVNSGRATRERNIEETALRTNLEAAEEIARQLRLRDLAGLIVIDFIDMEEHRNQAAVERRLKETLRHDRARIQVGRISPFGLLEMSRQRLRPSLAEASTQPCPHCAGSGFIRSTESTALHVLRSIEEEGVRRRAAEICVYVPTTVALYILNHKRRSLAQLEARYDFEVFVARDDALIPPAFRLERLRAFAAVEAPAPVPLTQQIALDDDEEDEEATASRDVIESAAFEDEGDDRRRRGRRRRRRRRDGEAAGEPGQPAAIETRDGAGEPDVKSAGPADSGTVDGDADGDAERQRRRRGRRGGRRRLRQPEGGTPGLIVLPHGAETVEIVPAVTADPGTADEVSDPGAATGAADWPTEMATELASGGAAAGIETASLAALAGEPVVEKAAAEADESIATQADREIGAAAGETAPRAAGNGAAEDEALPAPGEATSQTAGGPVQTVTEKPANPRRGWWQRLVQP